MASHSDITGIIDTDSRFVIDIVTGKIENHSDKESLRQYSHNSERFSFEMPRHVEGHDMTNCTKVTVNYLAADIPGEYEVDDLAVDSEADDKITFSWLISSNVTQKKGKLRFAVVFECAKEDGTITYRWPTDINYDYEIKETISNDTGIVYENVDILEQWKQQLFYGSNSVTANIQAEGRRQQALVANKGSEVKKSIPDDYATLSDRVSELCDHMDLNVTTYTFSWIGSKKVSTTDGKLFDPGIYAAPFLKPCYSNFVTIGDGIDHLEIHRSANDNKATGGAFYSAASESYFISGFKEDSGNNISVPDGAKYFRINSTTDGSSNLALVVNGIPKETAVEVLKKSIEDIKADAEETDVEIRGLKEDLVELNEYNIEYTNNILDISDKNILNGYGIKLNGGNCLTDINSCLIENSERLAFKNPVKIENGIYYKVCNSDGVNEVAGNSWESYLQYVGVYDENGDYITRIENSTFGFFINGKSFRQYTNSLYTKYKDYELSKIPSYVLVSATKVNKKYVKQLRKSTNEAERITNFVPYKLSLIEKNTLQIKKNTLQIEKNTAVIKELQSNNGNNGIRLLFVSDLHYYTEHPEHLEGGVPERDRMQMLIDAVNAENQKKKVNALFILGDFERGYGKKSAEYFSEHYASQLQMPYYAIAGDHDFYTSGEWESIWGYGREYTVDISNLRFIIVDVYKDTIGVKENNATVVSSLDEENQIERINQALSENKLPIILCHYDNGIIGDKTTKNWRNYIRSNVKAVFRAHTHNVVINNNGYGDLLYYTVGNFSYPPDANWENINDKNGNPTNRWSFRELYAEGEKYVTRQIYPRQTITVNEKTTNYDYSMSEKSVVL